MVDYLEKNTLMIKFLPKTFFRTENKGCVDSLLRQ